MIKRERQTPPFSVQLEFTEGCNLGCSFCGLQGMKENGKGPFYYMSKETLLNILNEVKRVDWSSRFIIAMHGEPTLNKNFLEYISLIREYRPNAVISVMTNGCMIKTRDDIISYINEIRESGLNDLIFDSYSEDGDAMYIQNYLESNKDKVDFNIEYLGNKNVKLYSGNSKEFRCLFNPPIQNENKVNRHLCNHCGAAAPLDFTYNDKRCARPFREITFRYDGSVALCCNDFRGEYFIGNINNESIEDIWYSPKFESARKILYHKDRSFKPCYGCNALSLRVGLLPDKMGKQDMNPPTQEDYDIVNAVTKDKLPLATIIKREWE